MDYTKEYVEKVIRERDYYRNALEDIVDMIYPATYVGVNEKGMHIYGSPEDASKFAKRVLENI